MKTGIIVSVTALAVCWTVCGFAQPNGFDVSAKSVWSRGPETEMNTLVAFRTEFAAKSGNEIQGTSSGTTDICLKLR